MTSTILTIYVLMWPVIVAGVLWVLCRAFFTEWRRARSRGEDLI